VCISCCNNTNTSRYLYQSIIVPQTFKVFFDFFNWNPKRRRFDSLSKPYLQWKRCKTLKSGLFKWRDQGIETRFSPNPNNPGLKPQSGHLDHRLDSEVVSRFVVASLFFCMHATDWLICVVWWDFGLKFPIFWNPHLLCKESASLILMLAATHRI